MKNLDRALKEFTDRDIVVIATQDIRSHAVRTNAGVAFTPSSRD